MRAQVAVHPQVVDYIDSCVMTMHKLLHRNELRKMVLHIADAAHNPVEQFVFEVSVPVDGAPQSNGSSKMEYVVQRASCRNFLFKSYLKSCRDWMRCIILISFSSGAYFIA